MREFLKAFGESSLTAMSGIFSVLFWAVAAVGEAFSFPISVRVAFIFAAAGSMYYAAYRVWRNAKDAGVRQRFMLESRIIALEAQQALHQEELHRARTSDPERNAVRHEAERLIEAFQQLRERAATNRIPAEDLYPLEHDANRYFQTHLRAYRHFGDDYPIPGGWTGGEMIEQAQASARCDARIKRLREILQMLS